MKNESSTKVSVSENAVSSVTSVVVTYEKVEEVEIAISDCLNSISLLEEEVKKETTRLNRLRDIKRYFDNSSV